MSRILGATFERIGAEGAGKHPFGVPSIQALLGRTLRFTKPVTIFVGENGSGKSTLLEGIACAADAIAIGSSDLRRDESLGAGHALAEIMTLSWQTKKSRNGFFLRAEDFFGYALRIDRMKSELRAETRAIEQDASLSPMARGLALMPLQRDLYELNALYGEGIQAHSHDEDFLALF